MSPPRTPNSQLTPTPTPPAQKTGQAFGGPLGVIAIALGVGIIAGYTLDIHSHRCDRCSRKWWHFGMFNLGDESAHRCPNCGAVQWWKSSVPAELRQAHNAFGHDSYMYPGPSPFGAVANPPSQAGHPDEESTFVSADPMALVPSRDRR